MSKARRIIRVLASGSLLTGALVSPQPAKAAVNFCADLNSHACWKDYTGPNFCQVAVFNNVACAVTASNANEYGESVYCFQPMGIASAFFNIFAGAAAGQTADFNRTDKRIFSLTMGRQTSDVQRTLYVLREDGQLFSGALPNSLPPNGSGVSIKMSPIGTPSPIRAITFQQPDTFLTPSLDLYGVDKSNRLLRLKLTEGDTWGVVPDMPNMVAYYGGHHPTAGGNSFAVFLQGTSGTSSVLEDTNISVFPDVPSNVTLAFSNSNPSTAFFNLGRTNPVSVATEDAWLLTNSQSMSGRILRSTRATSGSRAWGPWTIYTVPDFLIDDALPWSIADAKKFRGVRGELFAIGRAGHLLNYIP